MRELQKVALDEPVLSEMRLKRTADEWVINVIDSLRL